ncbi:MAG TPA: CHRD domain-containing protein [Candidatus Accumulibacter sp.]|nr:CHRD domain-containing protein [Accumulibacter sp.]
MIARTTPAARVRTIGLALLLGALSGGAALAAEVKLTLSGANEVPPVTTAASGSGTIVVGDDGSVAGSVSTTGVAGTAAHIHRGAAGQNGPVLVPLVKEGDSYKVPAGVKFTAEQMSSFKAGELYVNVHSAANPGGEVRAQIK